MTTRPCIRPEVEVRTGLPPDEFEALEGIEQKVLLLGTTVIHHADARPSRSELKSGGHQASSESMTGIRTALCVRYLEALDQVLFNPHAAPDLHAIHYLPGRLDSEYLSELRTIGALQGYSSCSKDPGPADLSNDWTDIGATELVWNAIARHRHLENSVDRDFAVRHIFMARHIWSRGDAGLDDGVIWNTVVNPMMVLRPVEVRWIVEVNRQSLDRVIPDIAACRSERIFAIAGWRAITLKYGSWLPELFRGPGVDAVWRHLGTMTNEEYPQLLRTADAELRELSATSVSANNWLAETMLGLPDRDTVVIICDLDKHNLGDLANAVEIADSVTTRLTVILAHTVNASLLPTESHPENHSAVLMAERFSDDAEEGGRCRLAALVGGYVPRAARRSPLVTVAAVGATLSEVVEATDELTEQGVACDLTCLTSADLVVGRFRPDGVWPRAAVSLLTASIPRSASRPLFPSSIRYPHALAFVAVVNATPIACLGVDDFGQSGDVAGLYRHVQIDVATVVGAAWGLLDQQEIDLQRNEEKRCTT